jgi:hypothetical protein
MATRIDELIEMLKNVRDKYGNIPVAGISHNNEYIPVDLGIDDNINEEPIINYGVDETVCIIGI